MRHLWSDEQARICEVPHPLPSDHDLLMGRLAQRVPDARLLTLTRAFLNAGVLENGLFSATAAKSAVAAGRDRTFLGFSFTHGQRLKRRLAAKTLVRFEHESGG